MAARIYNKWYFASVIIYNIICSVHLCMSTTDLQLGWASVASDVYKRLGWWQRAATVASLSALNQLRRQEAYTSVALNVYNDRQHWTLQLYMTPTCTPVTEEFLYSTATILTGYSSATVTPAMTDMSHSVNQSIVDHLADSPSSQLLWLLLSQPQLPLFTPSSSAFCCILNYVTTDFGLSLIFTCSKVSFSVSHFLYSQCYDVMWQTSWRLRAVSSTIHELRLQHDVIETTDTQHSDEGLQQTNNIM